MKKHFYIFFAIVGILTACSDETLPKPKGGLRLDYAPAEYEKITTEANCPFTFEVNKLSHLQQEPNKCDINIEYPAMRATIYLTYKKIDGNITKLLKDAQKFTYEHTIKADNIASTVFANDTTRVYGMFYQVYGDAASQSQFYVTDSVRHFVSGSVYFRAVPNYDSIQPASSYIEKDVQKLMESLRWK
ncbi:gliding motility lipoprotein GldD [Capnocytophaga sp. oral taxon 878]|uniref:gliding motility lipoprotein GldD n=1 Tax=Capnocytophaga sp. oral taxon 878 TaxID=1316596 RepID=UPI000D025D26|nr:gliding motility lipoprotein GldD [Capnocytophaga sp. oral taxon 878]AVM51352.1 gliding motility lipoprotein GldD [Capnocytophaga sp. oral taxon 878]